MREPRNSSMHPESRITAAVAWRLMLMQLGDDHVQHDSQAATVSPNSQTPELAAKASNPVKTVFWGPNGLRALWRLSIFVAIQIAIQFAFGYFVQPAKRFATGLNPQAVIVVDGFRFVSVLIAAAIMGFFEHRSLASYGLPFRHAFGARFWEGIGWGFVMQVVTIMTLYVTGNASFNGFSEHGRVAVYFGALWAVAFLIVGLFEEFLFRGYPQFTLTAGIGFWPAAIVLAGLFWFAHMSNPGETWIGGLETALAALIFAASLWFTGNLWFAIGMHLSWDWTETYFFGVADSGLPATGHLLNTSFTGSKWMTGGTVGPEGSIVALIVSVLVIALLYMRFGMPRQLGAEDNLADKVYKPAA